MQEFLQHALNRVVHAHRQSAGSSFGDVVEHLLGEICKMVPPNLLNEPPQSLDPNYFEIFPLARLLGRQLGCPA